VGRLNGSSAGTPDGDQSGEQAGDVTSGLYRRSQIALGAAFLMLVGAVIAFADHARTVGIILLVGMLLGGMASFFFSVKFRNRAVAEARIARAEQAARVSRNRKSARPGGN
jgi:hypothetical protein